MYSYVPVSTNSQQDVLEDSKAVKIEMKDVDTSNAGASRMNGTVSFDRKKFKEGDTAPKASVRLCEAILVNDVGMMKKVLENNHGNVNVEDCYYQGVLPRGMKIINVAAKKRNVHFLEELLKIEMFAKDINEGDALGYTPLMYATDAGNIENVCLLLNNGADVFKESISRVPKQTRNRDKQYVEIIRKSLAERSPDCSLQRPLQKPFKRTVFHIASGRGEFDILTLLLNQCGNKKEEIVNKFDDNNWTPLFWAAQSGNWRCFDVLLRNQCKITCRDYFNRNILHIIAENNCADILRNFTNGNTISEKEYKELLETGDRNDLTPFMASAARGNVTIAELFINSETEWTKDKNGNYVFHMAAERGKYDILKFLLKNYLLKLKSFLRDDEIFIDNSVQAGRGSIDIDVVKDILGDIPSEKDGRQDALEMVWFPDMIRSQNKDGCNCFHLAAGSGDVRCLYILYVCCITMRNGHASFPKEYFNVQNNTGTTPLHYAIRSKAPDVIKFLINHGSDLMSRTRLLPMLPNTCEEYGKDETSDQTDSPVNENCCSIPNAMLLKTEENVANYTFNMIALCSQRPRTALNYILTTANGAKILRELFDQCIFYENNKDGKKELVVDFQLLICKSGLRMAIADEIYSRNSKWQPDVFLHPLLKSFIESEWFRRKYFPWFRFTAYFLYLLILTVFVWLPSSPRLVVHTFYGLVFILSSIVLVFCLPYFLPGQNLYDRVIGISQRMPPPLLALAALYVDNNDSLSLPFRSLALTLSWLSLIFYSNTLSALNQQAAQFQTVLYKMLQNIGVFLIVIFGFSFTFYILYFKEDNFGNVAKAFLYTTVILLQGGMENSPQFSRNSTGVQPEIIVAEGAISFLFMIVATVALLNMLVGLAVSGAEELRNEGRLVFMRHQAKLLLELDQLEALYRCLRKWWCNLTSSGSQDVMGEVRGSKDYRMVVDNDTTSLDIQVELHIIARERWLAHKRRNDQLAQT